MNIAENIHTGLSSLKGGYSVRKVIGIYSVLAAFILNICFINILWRLVTYQEAMINIAIWLIFAAIAFQMVTVQQLAELKNGPSNTPDNNLKQPDLESDVQIK